MSDNRVLLIVGLMALAVACSKESEPAEPQAPATEATPVAPEAPPAPADDETEPAAAAGESLGAAPAFTLADASGKQVSLSDFRGKVVVLEWFNPGCPFVVYAHGDGPLASQPGRHMDDGVVWLAINSGAPGKQGHGVDTNKKAAAEWNMTYPLLFDESGEVGKAYGAKTTPHMYVIDPQGNLVYRGALDNAPMGQAEGEVVNYVDAAIDALKAGEPVQVQETTSYGCSVKYAG